MRDLFLSSGTGHSLMVLAFVIGIGMMLAKIKVRGVSLGATWVLFVGILLSALGVRTDGLFLHFLKEFGLILFVFTIGLQVGPGFISSFRKDGLKLNMLALLIVVLAAGCALAACLASGEDLPTMVGVLTGSMTNTPGLGTAQQTWYDVNHGTFLAEVQHPWQASRIASAFAVAYPIGIIGLILVIVFFRHLFRVDLCKEKESLKGSDSEKAPVTMLMEVENPGIFGKRLSELTEKYDGYFSASEILRGGHLLSEADNPALERGDLVRIEALEKDGRMLKIVFGSMIENAREEGKIDAGNLQSRRFVLTRRSLAGRKLEDLHLLSDYGVTVTRIVRSGMDLVPKKGLELQLGDGIAVIGNAQGMEKVADLVGNSSAELDKPNLVPIFMGIGLGLILGAVPISFPGMSNAVHLGLAGGTLVVAILLGHFGPKWKITTYTTSSANLMLRNVGLCLLLGTVGLGAGGHFVDCFASGGAAWIGYAAMITVIPALVTGLIARLCLKINFFSLCGLLSGTTTNSSVLSFVRKTYGGEDATVSHAQVYPFALFLQVLLAQLLILIA